MSHKVKIGSLKFSWALELVVEIWKEVLTKDLNACGSQYGIGVFCLTEAGEQQIDWVPEKDWATLESHAIW